MLNEVSRSQRDKYYMVPHRRGTWSSQTLRSRTRRFGWSRWGWKVGICCSWVIEFRSLKMGTFQYLLYSNVRIVDATGLHPYSFIKEADFMLYVSYHEKNRCYGDGNFLQRWNLSSHKSSVSCVLGPAPNTGSVQLCPLNALTPEISMWTSRYTGDNDTFKSSLPPHPQQRPPLSSVSIYLI